MGCSRGQGGGPRAVVEYPRAAPPGNVPPLPTRDIVHELEPPPKLRTVQVAPTILIDNGIGQYPFASVSNVIDPAGLGYKSDLAKALWTWRKSECLTQVQAGARLGVSAGAFGSWETARSWPRAEQRERLREILADEQSVITALDAYDERRRIPKHRAIHTAALWTIEALFQGGDRRAEMGDLNGHGYLLDRLRKRLKSLHFVETGEDGLERPLAEVRRLVTTGRSDEVAAVFALHEYGVRSVVSLDEGPYDRYPRNPQTVEAMVLVRAMKSTMTATLAVHFYHRLGAKMAISDVIEDVIRGAGLLPRIQAAATESAIRQGLLDNRVKEYRFIARREAHDRFEDDRIAGQQIGRVETRVFPERGAYLGGRWLLDFLKGTKKQSEFDALVTFDGKQYDEARVTVRLPNGRTRTVNVLEADQRVGHALTFDLSNSEERPLPPEASDAELVAALHLLLEDQGR